ncbi:MAG: hypothetical protein AB7E51_03630 [Pseudodesulfovibrio sp.]|uniref:hypothetical protein n=1 Tax=Pseudodesulfovibrio sp. TaxID=2035812 RepID=UPI003D0FD7ED
MGTPKLKIVPLAVDSNVSPSESEGVIDCSTDHSIVQFNDQLDRNSTGEFSSYNESDSDSFQNSHKRQTLRSRNHKILLSYLSSKSIWETTNEEISIGSGIPIGTVRYGLQRLVATGCIIKNRLSNCGLWIKVLKTAGELGVETKHPNSTLRADKIDRLYKKTIYLSQEEIDRLWPNISKRGFLSAHYRELVQDFELKGFDVFNIKQALNYVEFQLSSNALVDRSGNPVAGVPAYLLKALRTNGYYSRPRNYVSPDEQSERDRLKEEERIKSLREETVKLKSFNWWAELLPDHPAKRDRMLGDDLDKWILHQYQKYIVNNSHNMHS